MSKSKKAPVRSARAKARAIEKLVAMVEREVQRALPANSTFEQRNDMSAEVMKETLFKRSDEDLRRMVTDEKEVEDDEAKYGRLDPPSSATYVGRWGGHKIEERLYRRVGVRNGPTIKPIELRAGIIEHMTPDMARIVGELSAHDGSRGVERTLRVTGLLPPSRAFLAKRTTAMGEEIADAAGDLEAVLRKEEVLPQGIASASCGMDRMCVRMSEEVDEETASKIPPTRTEPYERTPPPSKEHHYREAWVASASVYDDEGEELHTWRYAVEAAGDRNKLADRVAADVERIMRANPGARLHCIQDAAKELRAMPEALIRALPANSRPFVELVDLEHLMGYLENVVDACEPEGDPNDIKGWYRGELLRDDGAIDRIWRGLREKNKRLPGRHTKARLMVAKALSYIKHRKNKMRYASHYAANLPIGSGATESTCWQMQQRVKLPGQSWEPTGLRGILAMRALSLSERWDTAWQPYAASHRKDVRLAA